MNAAEPRLALYFVPGDGTALARFGHGVLGRDALARPCPPLPELPPVPAAWTAEPARYGFHATLKAPFRLATDVGEADLAEACAALARAHAPCPLAGLGVRRLRHFIALVQPGPDPAVDALAADAVVGLEPFRAPLDAAGLARRRPETLDAAARARLERWGYPHVLEGFRFHMTLSSSLPVADAVPRGAAERTASGNERMSARGALTADESPNEADGVSVEGWIEALAARYAETVSATPLLDRVALCRQDGPGAPFVRVAEFPLEGGAPDASAR